MRDMHPVHDLGLSEEFVREVEEKWGEGNKRWVAQPKDAKEDLNWKLQKRITWHGECGGGEDGAFFVASTNNRIFQFRCRYVANTPSTIDNGLIVQAPTIMECVDRCALPQYWTYGSTGCRNAEMRNNGECRMYRAFASGTALTYSPLSTGYAFATFVTEVGCNTFDAVATPLFTPCSIYSAGTLVNPAGTSTFSVQRQYNTRTPTSTSGQVAACTASYSLGPAVCPASGSS
jgi:hypothetical protein